MLVLGYSLSALIAVAIIFLGSRFYWAPPAASSAFGIPDSPSLSPAFISWLATKGTRDIVSGLLVFLMMADGSPRLLGEFLIVASLIPLGDATVVVRSGGSRAAALGIHGSAALLMLVTAAILITQIN